MDYSQLTGMIWKAHGKCSEQETMGLQYLCRLNGTPDNEISNPLKIPAYWDRGYHGATVYVFNGDILWESLGYKQPISYNHKMAGQKLVVSKFHLKMQGVHSGEWPYSWPYS